MREALADSTLIKIGKGIIGEALVPDTRGTAEIVSEGEDTEVSKSKDYYSGYFSKGIDDKSVICDLSLKHNQNAKKQTNSAFMTVLSSRNRNKRLCCVFPGSTLEIKKQIDDIF